MLGKIHRRYENVDIAEIIFSCKRDMEKIFPAFTCNEKRQVALW